MGHATVTTWITEFQDWNKRQQRVLAPFDCLHSQPIQLRWQLDPHSELKCQLQGPQGVDPSDAFRVLRPRKTGQTAHAEPGWPIRRHFVANDGGRSGKDWWTQTVD